MPEHVFTWLLGKLVQKEMQRPLSVRWGVHMGPRTPKMLS